MTVHIHGFAALFFLRPNGETELNVGGGVLPFPT